MNTNCVSPVVCGDVPLDAVLPLAERGWRLFPIKPRDKRPAVNHWNAAATSDTAQIREWSAKLPLCNWGLATGVGSRVFVLDIDGDAGRDSLNALLDEYGPLPETLAANTSRGIHFYFRCDAPLRCSAGRVGAGCDIRADGGYIIIAPSIHPSGHVYAWCDFAQQIALAPDWLLRLANNPKLGHTAARKTKLPFMVLPEGERNDGLARYAGKLRRNGAELEELESALLKVNLDRCVPPLQDTEVLRIAASIAEYEVGGPDILETAWQESQSDGPVPRYAQFLALCGRLQALRGEKEIALPLVRIGELLQCDWTQVRRYRKRAVSEGWLKPYEHYIPHRKAGTYLFSEELSH